MAPSPRQADPFDLYAARRLREMRTAKGWTQTRLAQVFGCSYQQVQKFEAAENRLSAARLAAAASAFGVPVAAFFPPPSEEGGDLPAEIDPRMRRLLDLMTYCRGLNRGQLDSLINIAKATAQAQAGLADVRAQAGRYVSDPKPDGVSP